MRPAASEALLGVGGEQLARRCGQEVVVGGVMVWLTTGLLRQAS